MTPIELCDDPNCFICVVEKSFLAERDGGSAVRATGTRLAGRDYGGKQMSSAAKAKGTLFESQLADYLQGQGVRAKRLPRTGVKDIGDVAFPLDVPAAPTVDGVRVVERATVVVEAKNRRTLDLPTFIAESEIEAQNYQEKYPAEGAAIPVVVHKRRGKGVHQSYVTMSLDTFVDLLRQVGAL